MMLPLAAYRASGDAALLGPTGEISAGAFFARVFDLAEELPEAPFIINLCESRLGFMLGFAAALVRGQTSLLPSGQGRGDWEQLALQYPGAAIIGDRASDTPNAFDLSPYLVMRDTPQSFVAMPNIESDFIAAILFTSGSTGQPTAHAKSWGKLVSGAASLMAALGWTLPARHAVVGSVPPQHMFGLEATVMLPWQAGIPVHMNKPLLPADLEVAFAQCARPCWWMTTPLHLRSPIKAEIVLPQLAGVVASTMSLSPALAAEAEANWQVPVMEVYGSTETGALATRRTALGERWTPITGVTLTEQIDGNATRILASGSHIDVPVLLADELALDPDGSFCWLGRHADLLKIGGKRASLSALNQWIVEIPGIDDAVYFVPDAADGAALHDDAHPARRLAAFYVSATLSPQQVQEALRACVDPVFVPRPVLRVPRLPRNGNGKLPHAALHALYTQLKEAGGNEVAPQMQVPMDHPSLPGHFPGNPIVPGVVILSKVTDAIRQQLPHIMLETLVVARFHVPLRPGRPFAVHTTLRGAQAHFEVFEVDAHGAPGARIASGRWACKNHASTDAGG